MVRQTHTFAILDISDSAYREIAEKLRAAGYHHLFMKSGGRDVVEMHGVAVASDGTTRNIARADHWACVPGELERPAPCLSPSGRSAGLPVLPADKVRDAARFAVRACTDNGTTQEIDPDAFVIEMVNAMYGSGCGLNLCTDGEAQ